MEDLLNVKVCVRCGAPFTFRLSRFGCVFTCPCGECIDVVKAAALFTENLRTRRQSTEFIPVISSPQCELTASLKVAEVELDFVKSEFVVQLRNFSAADVLLASDLFSFAIREQVRFAQNTLSGPIDLVDMLVDELREAAEDPRCPFLVNPPATGLRSVVAQISSCGMPESLLDNIPLELFRALRRHQLEGVKKALELNGRILFADDMGVGKTLQAVATVAALEAFPLLVVCPSAVKFMWADQIEEYLHEQVCVNEIHIINGANDALDRHSQPKVVLTSYHMAAVLESQLLRRDWKCVVCDESHILHTNTSGSDATYTRAVTAIGRRTRYCLLLSGTPALSSPFDMYNQVDMLHPGLLGPTRFHFALRYCHSSLAPFLRVGASTRPTELSSLLSSCCMIRRLKSDVLELPVKSRVVLRIADRPSFHARCGSARGETTYQARYASCWKTKWSGIVEAVDYCCAKYKRVVLLAHHIELINALVKLLQRRSTSFVCIDGRVPAPQRGGLLAKFHSGEVQTAVVGITACTIGISLAPATCAVFCELPPDAVWMTQAEDRLHRPGQIHEVVVYYLLGVHSEFDAELFARLCRNLREVGSVVSQGSQGKLTLSQANHQAGSCLDTAQGCATHSAHTPASTYLVEEPLFFCISKNTGRIHVRSRDAAVFYTTQLWNEAVECVRQRQSPIWKQLDAFLTSFSSHTPFQQRQICLCNDWLPAPFLWKSKQRRDAPAKRTRYAKANMIGWGIWWEVQRQYFSNHYYFGPLQYVGGAYKVCCLNCAEKVLDFNIHSETLLPGTVCHVNGDTELFCCGKCRENFYFRRSSSAVRRTVASVDKSICAYCHVDCEALSTALAATTGRQRRLEVIQMIHPHLLQHPALYERIIVRPEPGNIWQADHITPVASGGGEALLDNVQTLCVLCHTLKTKEDLKHIIQYEAEGSPPVAAPTTSVATALRNCSLSCCETRVSRRRLSTPR
ncbi:putative SNF2/RAD54 related DNA helicase [Leptomonas seymouri]|uniref:Putative SNF2/RAD54 related DNA helicase n=1 Tax=Leptomonas seymouri TaxID=5684 RepID=A0A0N1IHR1_LEPSE|nr:putative SNF2/RAD54 related DNA helicase [Leptomonas seymouri]|eukprot:KPI83313.1 putative SNF2/RAD54 related DNA helicase [Leptomonas seymouri]